jgi:hypothetical protein
MLSFVAGSTAFGFHHESYAQERDAKRANGAGRL